MATPAEIEAALADLGHQLADHREAAGLTQEQLAGQTPFRRATIAKAETGTRRSARFWRIMDDELAADGALIEAAGKITAASGVHRLPPLRPQEDTGSAQVVTSPARCPHCGKEIPLAAQVTLFVAG